MKVFVAALIVIVFIFAVVNSGGNTSTTESVLDLAKNSDNMTKIVAAIDVAGDSVFNNVLVEVDGKFRGEVEQVPTSASKPITEHKIRDSVSLKYSTAKLVTLESTPAGKLYDLRLPASARGAGGTTIDTKGLNRAEFGGVSIPPVIKEPTKSNEWLQGFLFSESGLALNRLLSNYPDIKTKLDGKNLEQINFMNWMLGDYDVVDWNSYKTDRIVALRQIDVDALTGIDKNNKTISAILDPNRAYIYQVYHVNMTNFQELVKTPTAVQGFGAPAGKESQFVYDLARHINQMLGGRTLIIPNNDNSMIIDTDGNPIFFLN